MADPREVLTRPAPAPDLTLPYGPEPEHVVDVRFGGQAAAPAGGGALVVMLHGGFWRAAFDRRHLGPLAAALAARGYTVALPEFRRIGQPGGGWPGTFDDVSRLADALPHLVERIAAARPGGGSGQGGSGPGGWDPGGSGPGGCNHGGSGHGGSGFERVVLAGHSAGGHLAMWAAARHRLPAGSPWRPAGPGVAVRGVVALAPVADLRLAAELGLGAGAVLELLGGDPRRWPERYAEAGPAELLPIGVPVLIVHGARDDRVPIAVSRAYFDQAEAAGDPVQLRELPEAEHFALIDPRSPAWPQVAAAFTELTG